jgi:RNA polymerase sigma-70 factor (ECF subfamily)
MVHADKTELFVELITRYQGRVRMFILSLLPNWADAEEVLQETNLVLWRRFDEFEPGSDFRAWAFRIAYYKVRTFWDRQSSERLRFGDEFLDTVAAVAMEMPDDLDARREALINCMIKLSDKDHDLIRRRYRIGGSTKTVAEELGRSVHAIYKAVVRIRRSLYQCVQRTLAMEEHL